MPKFIEEDEINLGIKATKQFTDREEPRKVFWNNYENMIQNMKNNTPIKVISYYGFGGIGKSSLLLKLNEEIEEKAPKTKVAFLDFEKIVELNNNLLDILKLIISTFSKVIYYANTGRNLLKDRFANNKLKNRLLGKEGI